MAVPEEETLKERKGEKNKPQTRKRPCRSVLNEGPLLPFHEITEEVTGLKERALGKENKSTIMATQDQVLATNWRLQMRNEQVSPSWPLCKQTFETSEPILTECSEVAQIDVLACPFDFKDLQQIQI